MGGLLQMVFGNAGADVIARNMTSGEAGINPMQPGKKVECIFGFCDIRSVCVTCAVLPRSSTIRVDLSGRL
eukprot:COSAG05_NODE_1906_length_3849_cov_63.156800_2_plen_71_part_00